MRHLENTEEGFVMSKDLQTQQAKPEHGGFRSEEHCFRGWQTWSSMMYVFYRRSTICSCKELIFKHAPSRKTSFPSMLKATSKNRTRWIRIENCGSSARTQGLIENQQLPVIISLEFEIAVCVLIVGRLHWYIKSWLWNMHHIGKKRFRPNFVWAIVPFHAGLISESCLAVETNVRKTVVRFARECFDTKNVRKDLFLDDWFSISWRFTMEQTTTSLLLLLSHFNC